MIQVNNDNMTSIKIISNPYRRNVVFETANNTTSEWEPVNYQNNPGSALITEKIQKGFFPYNVKEVLRILQNEYSSDDIMHIIFEGTVDEYMELKEACRDLESIDLERSDMSLENARDILPRIVEFFSKIYPIVEKSISSTDTKREIELDIAKFIDASNDVVPICVLGNYSSGKSTFINALIGREILPSGDMPVTAKVYKIRQLNKEDHAVIDFEYNEKAITVTIKGLEYAVNCNEQNELVSDLKNVLQKNEQSSLEEKVNLCLEAINRQRTGVSDRIDIMIPFGDGMLRDAKNSFVVFDTPGSNTATHKDHFSILEDAMQNMSNGIPIYVAEYNSLDTCDNEILYEKIKSINQIDNRFTMIVVNKADTANIKEKSFDKDMEEMILGQAVPRNLYSGGIYFVSSVMGLGSKNKGVFIDRHAEEIFEMNAVKYSDVSSKWYKSLYKYNIMPEQIKQSIIDDSESSDKVIFANSGLLAVEHEVINFAQKYSSYDKCKQSERYIDRIIDATQSEIEQKKLERKQAKKDLENQLKTEKKALISTVEHNSENLSIEYIGAYDSDMKIHIDREHFRYSYDQMKDIEKDILKDKRSQHDYIRKTDDVRKARNAIRDELAGIRKQGIVDTIKGVGDDIKLTMENEQKRRIAKTDSDKETADELIQKMTYDYNDRIEQAIERLDVSSRSLWENRSEEMKVALLGIVQNSSTIDDEKKKELSDIIISYGSIEFIDDHVFEKASFEMRLRLPVGEINFHRINTKKLTDRYNSDYEKAINRVYHTLKQSHSVSFEKWKDQLVDKIRNNIVDYSPKLSEQAKQIEKETQMIVKLEQTKNILAEYSEQVKALMAWRTV